MIMIIIIITMIIMIIIRNVSIIPKTLLLWHAKNGLRPRKYLYYENIDLLDIEFTVRI